MPTAGVRLSDWASLDDDDREYLVEVFQRQIFPVLTPLAVDPGHPFPYISNLSLNLFLRVGDPVSGEESVARVKVPPLLPRFIVMPDNERFVPLEQVIAAHLGTLFPDMTIGPHFAFRVTRNADLSLEEDEADDLLAAVELELRRRRFGRSVRLELEAGAPDEIRELLLRELELTGERSVHDVGAARPVRPLPGRGPGPAGPPRGGLGADDPPAARERRQRAGGSLRGAPRARRSRAPPVRLVHHLGRGVHRPGGGRSGRARDQADPLPHFGGDSPIVASLIQAAELGKQVAAVVELKARFDEQNNILWARALEEAGVHVVYGIVGLKTHSKAALVVRREVDGIRRYCHLGTGNYNPTHRSPVRGHRAACRRTRPRRGRRRPVQFLTGFSRYNEYRKLSWPRSRSATGSST